MRICLLLTAWVAGFISENGRAVGDTVQIQAVAISGDPTPGVQGGIFQDFGYTRAHPARRGPAVNNAGQISFASSYNTIYSGVWSGTADNLSPVVRRGQPDIPGLPPGRLMGDPLSRVFLDDSGETLFGSFDSVRARHGLWGTQNGILRDYAVSGQPAPGFPGATFQVIGAAIGDSGGDIAIGSFTLGLGGHAAFLARINTYPGYTGVWIGQAGEVSALAYSGMQAPGMPDGVTLAAQEPYDYNWRRRPVVNRHGQSAFAFPMSNGTVGIFTNASGSLDLLARTGTQVPGGPVGMGITNVATNTSINDAGQLAFEFEMNGNPFGYVDSAIWSNGLGGPHVVATAGMQAPGAATGVVFGDAYPYNGTGIKEPVINGNGQVSFYSPLFGPGVDQNNDLALFAEKADGSVVMLAREGMQIPGMAPGVVYDALGLDGYGQDDSMPTMNGNGQVLFNARLSGIGGGLFLADIESGDVTLIARAGQVLELRPGVFGTLYSPLAAETGSGGQDGRRLSLNNSGQVAFTAEYQLASGGYGSGVFIASVPEPASMMLLAFGAVAVIMGRRRRSPCKLTSHRIPAA